MGAHLSEGILWVGDYSKEGGLIESKVGTQELRESFLRRGCNVQRVLLFQLIMAGSFSEIQICSNFDHGRLLSIDVHSAANIETTIDDQVFQDRGGGLSFRHHRRFSRATRNRCINW